MSWISSSVNTLSSCPRCAAGRRTDCASRPGSWLPLDGQDYVITRRPHAATGDARGRGRRPARLRPRRTAGRLGACPPAPKTNDAAVGAHESRGPLGRMTAGRRASSSPWSRSPSSSASRGCSSCAPARPRRRRSSAGSRGRTPGSPVARPAESSRRHVQRREHGRRRRSRAAPGRRRSRHTVRPAASRPTTRRRATEDHLTDGVGPSVSYRAPSATGLPSGA